MSITPTRHTFAGRNAVYQLAALIVCERIAVADA
jgi:hypothetical protein